MVKKIKRPSVKTSTKRPQQSSARRASSKQGGQHIKSLVALENALSLIKQALKRPLKAHPPHEGLSSLISSPDVYTASGVRKARTFAKQLEQLQDAYMVGGPPMSPITDSFFWYWSIFDIKHEPHHKAMIQQLPDELSALQPELSAYLKPLQDSHFGVYVCEGHRLSTQEEVDYYDLSGQRPHLCLRDLVTGERFSVIFREMVLFNPGQVLMLRLVELQRPTHLSGEHIEPLHASLSTVYLLSSPEAAWAAYFNRTLPQAEPERKTSYLRLMSSERASLLWLEYIHSAYDGQVEVPNGDVAIFLAGLPDVPESMPYGDMARVKLLRAEL